MTKECSVCGNGFDSLDNYMSIKVSVPGEDFVKVFHVHRSPCSEEVEVEGIL